MYPGEAKNAARGDRKFQKERRCCVWLRRCPAAVVDFLRALPAPARSALGIEDLIALADRWIPLAGVGFGWIFPALAGLAAGLLVRSLRRRGRP